MNIPRITSLKHPVYESFGNVLIKSEFTTNLMKHLDEALEKYNKNKHLVAINFLTFILKNIENPNEIPSFLGDNLIQHTLMVFRQLKGDEKGNEIKQLTHKLFDAILEALKRNAKEKTKIAVLKRLLFSPGTFIFEKITKSKLIQQITSTLETEGVKKLAKVYKEVIMLQNEKFNAESSETFQNNDRLYAAHLLVKLLGHSTMHNENEWKCETLKFLMHLGLTKQPRIGVELAASLKDTFYRSLDLKLSKLEDVSQILLQIFNDLDSLLSENNLETALRSPVALETYNTWIKAKNLIDKIESKKTKKVKFVFQILFLHLGLQLFNDVKLAKDSLQELFSCYDRMKKEKKSENDDDPAWIEVVVELFLSLLSHNSHLLRNVINCVFPHLCKFLNATAIHQILSVLDPQNEDNPLTNKNEISDEDDSEIDEEDNEQDEESGESDEEGNDSSEDDEDIEESNNDKLRRALHLALMQNENGTDDQSDIDLDQLDEEQGEKLNKALADVFRQYKPNVGKSKKQNKNEETLTHFRVRVLDMIEIYLDSNPSMILTLEIMLPLLQTLEFSIKDNHQKPLQDRIKSCLKKLSNLKKFEDVSEVTDKTLCDLLGSLLEKGTKSTLVFQFMGDEIAQCCTFIIRCSQNLVNVEETPKKVKKHLKKNITNVMKDSLDIYLTKRDCFIPFVLFKQVLQMCWIGNIELARNLGTVLFSEDIRPFRKSQVLELLKIFYLNHRLLSTNEEEVKNEILEITKVFLDNCMIFFCDLVKNQNGTVKEKFVSFFFNLLAIMKHCPIKCEEFDWKN
ncbi:hypothetical protein HHI36_021833 [Cryptolaemus montrouzieri]|uniref:DNA polymerase V n=1 Tax=Cryptolaemus montrouzieri TaxID=559131 RepID=A0ABD2MY99_9CUCU